jgi:hypothetical protein
VTPTCLSPFVLPHSLLPSWTLCISVADGEHRCITHTQAHVLPRYLEAVMAPRG